MEDRQSCLSSVPHARTGRIACPPPWTLGQRAELVDDLALAREAPFLLLGEERLVVGGDDEDAAGAADELGVDAELFLDLGRQTGGPREVVSNAAVVD